jgi:hypothetical protein
MRSIDASDIGRIERPASFGPVSQLQWLQIAQLFVDPRYQREISAKGRRNVRAIAEAFSWGKFAPVVVAPLEGGGYAIVDGQHRTTAAAALGIETVPCLIVQADPGEQARAFRAINAQVTRISRVQLFSAAVAAGEPDALDVAAMCAAADVSIRRSPTAISLIKPGETTSIGALYRLAREPRALALCLLRGIRSQAIEGTNPFRELILDALRLALVDHPAWWGDEGRFIAVLDEIDLDDEVRRAMARKARERGLSAVDALYARLVDKLQRSLKFTGPS